MSRVLCIDYGERRIGIAVSDPTRTIAQPLPTIQRRRGKRPPYSRIVQLVEEYDVESIVIGLPLDAAGDEGEAAAATREFGEALRGRTGLVVSYLDERFSSARAQRELTRLELPATARREKGRVDAMAALLLLQSYLDANRDP